MYCGHARLCVYLSVCLSVCLSAAACPHYSTDPDVTWGVVGDAPQFTIGRICNRCTGCVAMATLWKCVAELSGNPPGPAHAARTTHARTSDKIDARACCVCDVICNEAVPFRHCAGVATRTRNVSEYMLVLALCLVEFVVASSVTLSVLSLHYGLQYFSS